MPTITTSFDEYGGTRVELDGHLLTCITLETGPEPLSRFLLLVEKHKDELLDILQQYQASVQKNIDAPNGKGRYYPIFSIREKRIGQLCRQAGIIDS